MLVGSHSLYMIYGHGEMSSITKDPNVVLLEIFTDVISFIPFLFHWHRCSPAGGGITPVNWLPEDELLLQCTEICSSNPLLEYKKSFSSFLWIFQGLSLHGGVAAQTNRGCLSVTADV